MLAGNDVGNRILGHAADDELSGRAGDDDLVGGPGDDLLRNGLGAGTLDGEDGVDAAVYDDAPQAVSADLSVTGPQPLYGALKQTLAGIERLVGSPFGDRLTGSADANAIDGAGGADTIAGGKGADQLAGGGGSDAIDSRDAAVDDVRCGEGPDAVAADAIDRLAEDCLVPAGGSRRPARAGAGVGADADGGRAAPVAARRAQARPPRAAGLRVWRAAPRRD